MKQVIKFKLFVFFFLGVAIASGVFLFRAPSGKIDLSVVGYIHMHDGLGRQGPELIHAFERDLAVNFHPTRKVKGAKKPEGFGKYLAKNQTEWGKVVVFEDILWEPGGRSWTGILRNCPTDSIRLAYSMWESTRLPHEWAENLNENFDAVLVPSEFLVDTYQESGVEIPVFVVPLALDFGHFFNCSLKSDVGREFVFGNFSFGNDRKNHLLLIRAFHKAFGNDPLVRLVLRMRGAEKEVRNAITRELAILDAKNIVLHQKSLSKDDYFKKFREIDCYVSPSKGEGFSIQPREAMALGIPVIATNNTGQIDLCKTGLVRAVQTPISNPAMTPWGDFYGMNFTCDVDALADALTDMRENYRDYLSNGQEARQWARQFLFSNLKLLYASIISPSRVILGEQNRVTPNHIITNSLTLFEKYRKVFGDEVCSTGGDEI